MYPPTKERTVILSYCTMMYTFNKLVAVAEVMAAGWEDHLSFAGLEVSVEGNQGFVRLGELKEYPVYSPDENVCMPEYRVDYHTFSFLWKDGEWVMQKREAERVVDLRQETEHELDELPF